MTRFDASGVTDLLYDASADAPASRVDLGAVVRDGRRRRRRRAVAVPLLAAAVTVGIALVGLAVAELRPTGMEPVTPSSASPTATPTAPTTPAPQTEFPVDRRLFAHEALGQLETVRFTLASQYLQYVDATVWVFAAGADSARQGVEEQTVGVSGRYDAPPIHGRPASFLTVDYGDGPSLRGISFQWAAGAWADIIAGEATEAQLLDVAETLRTDVDQPERFWFTVSQPPGLHLVKAAPFVTGEEGRYSTLTFAVDGASPDDPASRVEVTVGQYFDAGGDPAPNATVGGRPAFTEERDEYLSVELLDTDPYVAEVLVYGDARQIVSLDDAKALALSVEILGTWEDRSQWTEDPIR